MQPVNNIFVFSFIQSATGQKKFAPIYKALHLKATDSGRRFKEGLNGNCWWPKHYDWFFGLVDGSKQGIDSFYYQKQEFPLDDDKENLIHIVSKENEKDFTINGEDVRRFSLEKAKYQWTFESCLFDYLMEIFKNVYHNDFPAILFDLAVHGKKQGLSNACLNEIAIQPDERSLARFLIIQAKSAAGLPLEIPEDTVSAVRHSEDLHTDDVDTYTYYDLQSKYTALEICEQLIRNDKALFPQEALVAHGGDARMWQDHLVANPENWMFLCNRKTKKVVGNWSFVFITPEQESQVRDGLFMEGSYTVEKRLDVFSAAPNPVAIYLLNLSTNDRAEDSRLMLWRSFAERIQTLAQKGIFLKGIYTNALDAETEGVFISKGFKYITHNKGGGEIYYLDLSHGFPEEFSYIVQERDLEKLCYQYWRTQFKCRQLTDADDLSEQQERALARLVWQTDPYIYPAMFTESQAVELLPLLFDDDSMFNLRNLYCGFIGDTIVGIILHHHGPLYWTADLLKAECKDLPATLDIVERDYFSEYQKTPVHARSIINCCVDSRWRMSGIRLGSEMMKQFLEEHPGEEMELFVLEETPAARKLYRRAGFRTVYHCDGFSIEEKKPPCLFMRRPANK